MMEVLPSRILRLPDAPTMTGALVMGILVLGLVFVPATDLSAVGIHRTESRIIVSTMPPIRMRSAAILSSSSVNAETM